MNRIAVVGSRTYPVTRENWDILDEDGREKVKRDGRRIVLAVIKNLSPGLTLISGGAKGPDTWAREAAERFSHDFLEFLPNYKKYGAGAPHVRNKEILSASNELIAFWDLDSKGTWHAIKLAAKQEKPFMIIQPDGGLFFFATKEDYEGKPGLLETMTKKKQLRDSVA